MVNNYGKYIIKAKVNLDGFLILNDMKTKVYSKDLSVADQFRLIVGKDADRRFKKFTDFLNEYSTEKSGKWAKYIWDEFLSKDKDLYARINGMMFSDSDGDVVVVYDSANYTPISVAECGEGCTSPQFEKINITPSKISKRVYSSNVGAEGSDSFDSSDSNNVNLDKLTPKGLDRLLEKNIIISLFDIISSDNTPLIHHAIKKGIAPITNTEKISYLLTPIHIFEHHIKEYMSDYILLDKFLKLSNNLNQTENERKKFNEDIYQYIIEIIVDDDVNIAHNASKILVKHNIIPTKKDIRDLYNMYPPYDPEYKHTEDYFKFLATSINDQESIEEFKQDKKEFTNSSY